MAIQNLPPDNALASDVQSLTSLKGRLRTNREAGVREAAQQFEALFLQMMLKSMRDTTSQDGLMDSDATRFFTGMLDEQIAKNISMQGGLGLAKMLEAQLSRRAASPTDETGDDIHDLKEDSGMGNMAEGIMNRPATIAGGNFEGLPLSALRNLTAAMERASLARQTRSATMEAPGSVDEQNITPREFARTMWPHAVEASRRTGIPPQFLIAHAALESGWGRRDIKNADGSPSHNLFGIKAQGSWQGKSVEVTTTEYVDGAPMKEKARFRAYDSYAEAFSDYARLLADNPRYGGVIGSQNGTEFARRLQQAGYATDPKYAEKLSAIIDGSTLRQALIG
ncbi:MAG: flagellar assembly peptidoglycan hydrolase FlgJ [Zoogloeaceae bacterium]|jgi:flagellar protein FlgJ|nr:flagellar assembly peptidoglycan hydrolase FlgJ [Zoogloeaceae bacterium]